MATEKSFISRAKRGVIITAQRGVEFAASHLRRGPEAEKASAYWGNLPEYHLTNDSDPVAIERSEWLAGTIIPALGVSSLLEIGTNSGRNLRYIHQSNPEMRLKGIDVNARAIEYARSKSTGIEFDVADANHWAEPSESWDAALTMSVLDHIPDNAVETLAANVARSARYIVAVELWDGHNGTRGLYKYSRDTRAVFERNGFDTVTWEKAPGQYDEQRSLLWVYVGRRR